MKSLSCPDRHCSPSGKGDAGAIIHHGFHKTPWETASLPIPNLREDVRPDNRDTLPSTPGTVRPLLMKSRFSAWKA